MSANKQTMQRSALVCSCTAQHSDVCAHVRQSKGTTMHALVCNIAGASELGQSMPAAPQRSASAWRYRTAALEVVGMIVTFLAFFLCRRVGSTRPGTAIMAMLSREDTIGGPERPGTGSAGARHVAFKPLPGHVRGFL